MANTLLMDQHFEREKNLKASGITVVVCACLFLLFFFVRWKTPEPPKPIPQLEGIEVNLGTTEDGSGTQQPLIQGNPGPTQNPDNTPQQSSGAPPTASEQNTDERDPDGPAASAPNKTSPKVTATNPAPVKKPEPTPPAPKPKTVMPSKIGGGNDDGKGNTKESYNKPGNEGDGKGPGDKGQPGGNPDRGVYTGPVVTKGDRYPVTKFITYDTDVPPATIYADISVDEKGKGTFIEISRGSSSNNEIYKKEIRTYLTKHKFNAADHVSTITMKFVFKR